MNLDGGSHGAIRWSFAAIGLGPIWGLRLMREQRLFWGATIMPPAFRGAAMQVAVGAGVVLFWGIMLLAFLASVQRMRLALAVAITVVTIGLPFLVARGCPRLWRRWWLWPILLLLALDLVFTWQTVCVYDERTSPATRAKEADARRRAAALE
jgi:hypothetical protein